MFEKSQTELREDICAVGRMIWQRGYVAANDGNISVRLSQDLVLATPTGVSKGLLKPDMLVLLDMNGRQLDGHLRMSSEIQMHLAMYRERCDVASVVHSHPPYSTGFAVYGEPLNKPTLPEAVVALGNVPLAPYGKPSTPELGESVAPYVREHDVFLLANHGVLALGRDVHEAYFRTETLEHLAKISFIARMLGRENVIAEEEIPHLEQMRAGMGLDFPRECLTFAPGSKQPVHRGEFGKGGPEAACPAGAASPSDLDEAAVERIVREVAERVTRRSER